MDTKKDKELKRSNSLGFFLFMSGCLIVFVGVIAAAVFFIAVRGAEQTMVPNVRGKELIAGLLELQEKELYPQIQLRYSQSAEDKGIIVEQEPEAGSIVKAGRRIKLVVSQGVILNKVGNYLNRNVNDVRLDIQSLAASAGQPLLSLREPFMYEYSAAPGGTILQQKPEPGTNISGPTALELVVSRGQEYAAVRVPPLVGLSLADALEEIGRTGINFAFTVRPVQGNEGPETVVSQSPEAQSSGPENTPVYITLTAPREETLRAEEVFGLFSYTLPQNPYPLLTQLDALLPSGERRTLIAVPYAGGTFGIPYRLPVGSLLVLSALNREIYREVVMASRDDLSIFSY
jgi:beta-lactam-binding protein with PASTA domain